MENPILNLRWRQHGLELSTLLDDVQRKGLYSDVIISCEDQHYPVHSVLLAISSDFFAQLFKEKCCDKNFIVIKDVLPFHLEKLLIYIYSGEVSIHQDEITRFVELGKSLQIKGAAFTNGDDRAIPASSIDNLHDRRPANSSNYTSIHEEAARPQCLATPSLPMDLTLNMSSLNTTPNMIPSASTSTPMSPLLSSGTTFSISSSQFPSSSTASLKSSYVYPSSVSLSTNSELSRDLATAPSSTTLVNSVKSRVTASVVSNEQHKEVLSFETLIKEEPKNSEEIFDSDNIDKQSAHANTEAEVRIGEKKILGLPPPMIPVNSRNEDTYRTENFHNMTPTNNMPIFKNFTKEINQKVATSRSTASYPFPETDPSPPSLIATLETNSHLGLNSSSYSIPRDEDCIEDDYLKNNYINNPIGEKCYRVFPISEAAMAKDSQCHYSISHCLDDGNYSSQHKKMSSNNRKDLDPKIQVNRTNVLRLL